MALRIGLACIQVVPRMLATGEWHAVLAVMPPWECDPEGSGTPFAWPTTDLPRTIVPVSDVDWTTPGSTDTGITGSATPTEGHARMIVSAARHALALGEDGDHGLLVHCHAGISRSVAAIYAIEAIRHGPGREAAAFRALGRTIRRDDPTPNRLLVASLDRVLGRGGAMTGAIDIQHGG